MKAFAASLEVGVDFATTSGVRVEFGTSYDGLFRSGHEAWGATFGLGIPIASITGTSGATVNLGITLDGPFRSGHEAWECNPRSGYAAELADGAVGSLRAWSHPRP